MGAVTLALVAGAAAPSSAGGGRTREDVQEYSAPRGIGAETDFPGVMTGRTTFDPGKSRAVSFVIEDVASPAVFGVIVQNDQSLGTFCGHTDGPVAISPGQPVDVELYSAPCGDAVGAVTTGVVRATFSQIGRADGR